MNLKKFYIGLSLAVLGFAVVGIGYLQSTRKVKISADTVSPRIYVQTSKTTFVLGEQISASVIVDGAGQNFTSFKADVALNNLTVVDGSFVIGPLVSNWQKQPTSSSLSFLGGIQGTTTSITVYTMSLKATAAGTASISLSNGSILQVQPDGMTINNILGSVSGSTYTVTAPETIVTPPINSDTGSTVTTPTAPKKTTVTKKTTAPVATPTTPTETPVVAETPVVEEIIEEPVEPHQSTETLSGNAVPLTRILIKDYTDKDDIVIEGKADPDSDLTLSVYSDPLIEKIRSDSDGKWSIKIGSLEAGDHRVEITYADSPSLTPKVITTFKVVKSLNYYLYGGGGALVIVTIILLVVFFIKKRRTNQPIAQNSSPLQMPKQSNEIAPKNDFITNQNFIAPIPSTKDAEPANPPLTDTINQPEPVQSVPAIQTPVAPDQNAPIPQPQPQPSGDISKLVAPRPAPTNQPIVPVDDQSVASTSKPVATPNQPNPVINNRIDSISKDASNAITKVNDDNPNF